MIYLAGSGHPGGSLSVIDIMTVIFFGDILRYRADQPKWPQRDRFVLSKGHAAPALYAVLSEAGFFPKEDLWTLRKLGSTLHGHPFNLDTPGVEAPTGSLGQGLSIAHGMALGLKLLKQDSRVFAILGDGEIEEGNIWEAAMSAGFYKSGNLTAIIDYNHLQIDGYIHSVKSPEPIPDKFKAFLWDVIEIDGHDHSMILNTLKNASQRAIDGPPLAVIAHTVKGKGVSFMEDCVDWHGVAPNKEQYEKAMDLLNG